MKTVASVFNDTVKRYPDCKAVVDSKGEMTYTQLDQVSNQIADYLTGQGFGAGQIGALLMHRNNLAIAAMIGILKTGGTYFPMEPSTPFLRNRDIILESNPSVLLTTQDALEASEENADYTAFTHILDVETMTVSDPGFKAKQIDLDPDSAYIIFTSGSTGTPKGAINRNSSLLNLVEGLRNEIIQPYIGAEPLKIAVLAPFIFDPSLQQIFSALLYGHCLYIAPNAARLDGRELIRFFNKHEIDISDGTPTHLKLMAQAPESTGNFLCVKHFIIGGEAMSVEVVKRFWARFSEPKPKITNIYGVAECCVDATHYQVELTEIESLGFVPIGKPFANMKVVILNENLRPVAPAESGEICIGSLAVGHGYIGREELNARCFIPDPKDGTQKLYRTGDRATLLPDGNIRFMDRFDRQIKLRGYRIEPSEIESVIRNYSFTKENEATLPTYTEGTKEKACTRCLLTDRHPGVTVEGGICSLCREFDSYKEHVDQYFQTEADFHRLMEKARQKKRKDAADILLLYSGGKDSTYVLFRLIEMGYKVDTFTFDNGFISRTAFENIHRTTNQFGIHHVDCTINNMTQIFAESLSNSSTVCNGCFRSLTLLSTQIAYERGIPVIVTGLSRGQIMDTKLKNLYASGVTDSEEIDRQLIVHRKIFYSQQDTVSKTLNMSDDESIYEIHYIDFFRYFNISAPEIRKYLAQTNKNWIKPKDTGFCSTNCRLNNVGIYVHKMEKGYHNYAEPLSWDIRLGVASLAEAREELMDEIDVKQVDKILKHLSYKPKTSGAIEDAVVTTLTDQQGDPYLVAHFVSSSAVNIAHLREYLSQRLTDYMVPKHLVRVESIPLNHNGKIAYDQLPVPEDIAKSAETVTSDDLVAELTKLWIEVLGLPRIEIDDNFFDLGGHSLAATILVGLIEKHFGKEVSVIDAVKNPTIREMVSLLTMA